MRLYYKNRKFMYTYFCVFSLLVVLNILPVIIYRDRISFCFWTLFPLAMLYLTIWGAVISYLNRYKGFGIYTLRRRTFMAEEKDECFKPSYLKHFMIEFALYCSVIPFFIPCIFFATNAKNSFWGMLLMLMQLVFFIAVTIADTLKDRKKYNKQRADEDRELREQEQRESMGKWK